MHRYTSKVFGNKTNLVAEHQENEGDFSAASLSIKAQKKIASKLSTRKTTKLFLNEAVVRVFDGFYDILRTYYNKKDSEKVVKNIIKLAVKMTLLSRNDMLSEADVVRLMKVQKQLHSLTLTIISFVQVRYSFERSHLIDLLKNMQSSLAPLVSLKLSDKSTRRLEHVIIHLTKVEFLDDLFKKLGPPAPAPPTTSPEVVYGKGFLWFCTDSRVPLRSAAFGDSFHAEISKAKGWNGSLRLTQVAEPAHSFFWSSNKVLLQ
ncbi:hypothetical protein Y032_0032g2597 [Ancylostoma ceylanicum]|uniref:Uncharacterized protein n=1 Tax=Ancylostoma ceylanicum TaxID=53326 RepID=A0A016UP79_9BILA|nr:hypothetical protein Y032_0032g2597 [Ancylostoma ceylanicum]